jgi:hypothetical protein
MISIWEMQMIGPLQDTRGEAEALAYQAEAALSKLNTEAPGSVE